MKVIFLVQYPPEGPSSRLRVWQYLTYLEKFGVRSHYRPFMSSAFYKIVFQQGHLWLKMYYFIGSVIRRLLDIFSVKKYDLVFVQKEVFPFGPPIFESIVVKVFKKPLIYDFDDAIFLKDKSKYNSLIQLLKNPQKVSKIIQMSTCVIAGNKYLQEYATKHNRNVYVIITPVDTEKYRVKIKKRDKAKVVIGWIGTHSTSKYLLPLRGVFQKLIKKYPNLLIRVIGGRDLSKEIPEAQFWRWDLKREVEDLATFDIGIMPLPEDEWSKGKCGYKVLQYMAVGIPVVCSPVGINKEIVKEGVNGLLASSQEEWFHKLSTLIENPGERIKMGRRGREITQTQYSLNVCLPLFYRILRKTFDSLA